MAFINKFINLTSRFVPSIEEKWHACILYMRFSFREVNSVNSIPVYKSWSQKGYKPISVQRTDSNSTFSCTFNLVSSVNSSPTSKKGRILIRKVTTSVSFSRSYKLYSLLANPEFRYKFLSAVCKLQQLLCRVSTA